MQNPEIKLNYLNVCVHSRSQDIVGFGHALVFVIALVTLALVVTVAALPCLGLSTTYSRISLASLPQSPVLVSLTHSHTQSLSPYTYPSNLLTHTHTLACSLTHCSSTRQAFVRSFVCRTLTTTTKKFSRTAAARCPFTRLGLDWPRRVLLPGVFVLVLLLCFTSYVLVCVLSPSLSLCVCVLVLVLVCRHGALCFVGWTTTTTTERQPQPQQSQRRRARRSTPRSSRVLPPLPLAPHISLNDEAATVAVAVHAARAAVEAATNKQLVSHRTTTNDDALLNTELNFILSLLTIAP